MPGESFSGYNLRVQQAVGSLMRYQKTAERFHSAVCRQMLMWCAHSGKPIDGYGDYKIEPEDIDTDKIYVSVKLTPDVPLDRMQKINSAVMMSRELKYPATKILEELGETDPQGAIDEWAKEQFYMSEVAGRAKMIQAEYDLQIQQAQMQMQMQAQQATMQMQSEQDMQMQAMQAQMGQSGQQPMPGGPMGMEGVEGMGMNPAMGGMPPAQAGPALNVREQQTGRSMGGEMV
jgi:hypothetical protein